MAEDWLPEPPPPPPPAKSRTARTLVIWVVLIVVFVAIYSMSSETPGPATAREGYSGWWIVAGVIAGMAAGFGFLAWQLGGGNRLHRVTAPGFEALATGRYAQAAERFDEVVQRSSPHVNHRAIGLFYKGYALNRAGESAAAVGALLGVERIPTLGPGGIRQSTATELVRAFVIGGDLDKAERWLASSRERPPSDNGRLETDARLAAVEALLRCRQGRFEDALAVLEARWDVIEYVHTVVQMREVWLLRAFALASTSSPRDSGAAEPWLRLVRGTCRPGAFGWLTERWPELAAFVTTHGLAAGERAAS